MSDLHDRPLILDFGIHLGENPEVYLTLSAKVIGFEANDVLIQANRKRFHKEIECGQLEIVEGAITAPDLRGDSISFYVARSKSVWETTKDEWVTRNAALGTSIDRIVVPAANLVNILFHKSTPH